MAEWNGRVDDGAPFIPLFLQRIFCFHEETCLYKLCTLGMKGAFLCLASASVGLGLVVSGGGEEFLQYPTQLRGAHPYPSGMHGNRGLLWATLPAAYVLLQKRGALFHFLAGSPFPLSRVQKCIPGALPSLLRSPTQKETKGRA